MIECCIDIVGSLDDTDEKDVRAREELEILMNLAEAKLDAFQSRLEKMFLGKEYIDSQPRTLK